MWSPRINANAMSPTGARKGGGGKTGFAAPACLRSEFQSRRIVHTSGVSFGESIVENAKFFYSGGRKSRVPGSRDAVKSGDIWNLAQPLTEPAVTPLMMSLLRAMYTTTTGRMASRMNMYTLPMSNLE